MKASAPIFLIVVAVVGFTSGALLDGELSPHTLRVPNITIMNFFENAEMAFINDAQMSHQGQAIIEHATIDFGFDTFTNEEGFFENVLNECIFSSDASFGGEIFEGDVDSSDNGVCIICKIKGECMDVHEDFLDLKHGTKLGAINSLLATNGIFLTVDALGGRPDTAIIFNGSTPGGPIDTASEPDPDLRADNDQLDGDTLGGICAECEGLNMLIIPENVNDNDFDNLVDIPNDSAAGGTMKFQFEVPRRIVSFNFTDMDRPSATVHEARAYSDFSCNTLIGSAVTIPNSFDGDVQIIYMNKDDARCLEIEAHDSFGVSNLVVECMKIEMDGKILGVGKKNLPDGYTAGEEIHLPIDPPVSVFVPQHVDIKILSAILNYQGLNHGDALNNQFLAAYGIKISGAVYDSMGNPTPRDPIVFDTELSGTSDFDLEVDVGNISIVQENTSGCPPVGGTGTCNDPDDNAAGGFQKFQFDPKRYVNSLIWIDADRPEPFGTIFLYSDYDCNTLIDQGTDNGGINIPFTGDKTTQVLVPVLVEKVGCMVADYVDSGGLSKINFGCPLPDDPLTMPWFKGEHQGSSSQESIYFTSFPNDPSDDPLEGNQWTLENQLQSGNGHYFGILEESGDWTAYAAGDYVLAGWGSFAPEVSYIRTPIDISNYNSVVVSIQYSYEDTEDADAFFFEYKNGANWIKIVDVESPVVSGQLSWTLAEENIPDSINSLELRFTWTTSSSSEHVMIDNLEVFGIPN